MNSTNTTHRRPALALLAPVALSMAALLSGCDKAAPGNESASTDAQEGKFPTKADMQAWRVRRDGFMWKINVFDIQDLKCHTLTDKEKAKKPGGVKAYDEKFLVSVACDYTLVYDRVMSVDPTRKESIKRKVVADEWYIARTADPAYKVWHSAVGVPQGQNIN